MVGGTRGWVNVLRLTFTTPPNRPQDDLQSGELRRNVKVRVTGKQDERMF